MQLNHAEIARRIPHQGSMCLLDAVLESTANSITCATRSHLLPENPLRHAGVLGAANGVEYAAQAMALHCALQSSDADAPGAGYLASVRDVTLHAETLDVEALPLHIVAERLAASAQSAMYAFTIHAGTRLLVAGRLSAIMDANLPLQNHGA